LFWFTSFPSLLVVQLMQRLLLVVSWVLLL
jgi:hypothetical protein